MTVPRFILSLDFELMWGVRDHRSIADYGDAVLGVRQVLPAMLGRFRRHGIRATWATVGLLFARNRDEMRDHAPARKPAYENPQLSPYDDLARRVGRDEAEDPYHFGRSLLDRVAETPGQEIGTHTFSHFYCLERGATLADFAADIASARAIAATAGHMLRSIVFPRNQMTPEHVRACAAQGIVAFRGNPGGFAYAPRMREGNTPLVRAVRLLDGVAPVAGRMDFAHARRRDGAMDVPASRFLRPWNRRLPGYSALHVAHIRREMRAAARLGRSYHLWWHPHNMGRNMEANLAQLDAILATFRDLRERHGMESMHMADVATRDAAEP